MAIRERCLGADHDLTHDKLGVNVAFDELFNVEPHRIQDVTEGRKCRLNG